MPRPFEAVSFLRRAGGSSALFYLLVQRLGWVQEIAVEMKIDSARMLLEMMILTTLKG